MQLGPQLKRDALGTRMKMVRVPGPAGSYEVPLHAAPLHTRVLQGVGLSIGMTLFRAAALRFSFRGVRGTDLLAFFGALTIAGAVGGLCYYGTDALRVRRGWRQTVANVITLLTYGAAAAAALLILLGSRAWETN